MNIRPTPGVTNIGIPLTAVLLSIHCILACGCKPKQPAEVAGTTTTSNAETQAVPLRVWFVGEEASAQIIQRQWQSSFERKLELRMLSEEQLSEEKQGDCDVVIYPAHMLGELIARKWIVELPKRLQPQSPGVPMKLRRCRVHRRRVHRRVRMVPREPRTVSR